MTAAEIVDLAPTTLLRAAADQNAYLQWRSAHCIPPGLGEKPDQRPPEALLQRVWLYQRLLQDRLQTSDGRPLRVLHPGFWNHEPGPDFRNAVLQFSGSQAVTGDIEIDLVPGGWEQHGHATNLAYANVILHVTWEPESAAGPLPNLALKHLLDSTVPELSFWIGMEPKPAPEGLSGKCSGPFRNLPADAVSRVLRQAAHARLLRKAEQIQARARQSGWDAALFEALFGALGYKRNVWPMRRLGQLLPELDRDLDRELLLTLQVRLLGVGGLLPAELPRAADSDYFKRLWQVWWRDADTYAEVQLPKQVWTLGGIRPANHPQRRVATAAHWRLSATFVHDLDQWLERTIESPDLLESITQILQVKHDPFWSHHWTLKSAPFKTAQPLLGAQRITDLAMNVVIPWLYVRALSGRNEELAKVAERRYLLWPPGEDNSILKLARQRLFGGVSAQFLKTAAQQQGLLQIVRDFCGHSDAVCGGCQFPEMLGALVVREIGSAPGFTNLNA